MRLALLSMFAACAWAQLRIDIHPVTGRASDQLKETERILRIAQRSPFRVAGAPEELAIVEAIVKTYRLHFLPEIDSAPRIATVTDKGNDILVARWAASDLIVWDTPENTSFIFKLPAHSWSSESAIRSTFEKLALPRTNGVTLNVARDAQTQQWIGAGGLLIKYPPYQFDLGAMNSIDLWETTGASYLCVTFSAWTTRGPPNMLWFPERFPPLETRVGRWTKKRLLDELSPAGAATRARSLWSGIERDRVLARELVRRELTEDEFLALLESRSRGREDNGMVLEAVVRADQVRRFANEIRRYLQSDSWPDTILGNHPFDIVGRAKDVDFTDIAIEVLRRNAGAAAARRYAIAHGAAVPPLP
jgi:hypothetical protein